MAAEAPPTARRAVEAAVALRTALVAVRGLTLTDLARAWRVVDLDGNRFGETLGVFGTLGAAILLRGQRSAVRLSDVWAAGLFRRPTTGLDPARFVGLRGTDAPVERVLAAAGVYVLDALNRGADLDLAMDAGLYRAERIVSTETMRAGLDAVATLAEAEGSPGWRRRTRASACDLCRAAADGSLRPWDERVAAHPHCSCIPVPVLAGGLPEVN